MRAETATTKETEGASYDPRGTLQFSREHEGAVTEGRAYIRYEASTGDWELGLELFEAGSLNRYRPVEIWTFRFEWLGDAMTQVSNAIRSRGLQHCEIEVVSEGQAPLVRDEWAA